MELTEQAKVDDYPWLSHALDQLRQMGVRLAIDDTGAGFASLAHILKLAPDFIKLDRELTSGIDHDPVRRALAAARDLRLRGPERRSSPKGSRPKQSSPCSESRASVTGRDSFWPTDISKRTSRVAWRKRHGPAPLSKGILTAAPSPGAEPGRRTEFRSRRHARRVRTRRA